MTMLSGLLPRLGSLFAQRGVQAIAAGFLSGALGGTALVASGLVPVGGTRLAPPSVALVACPGSGAVLAKVPSGEALLVTARSADGGWLQVYIGEPGLDRAWAPASALKLQSASDTLPVADCAGLPPPVAVGSPGPTPAATPTVPPSIPASVAPATPILTRSPTAPPKSTLPPTPKPTPKPTQQPSPTATPFVDTTAPSVGHPTTDGYYDSGSNKWYIFSPGGGCTPDHANIYVTVTDPDDAVAGVTLYIKPWGYGSYFTKTMTFVGSNTWHATIDTDQGFVWSSTDLQNQVYYWVNAVDSHGNTSGDSYPTVNYLLYKGSCIL
jgi:hypothetical protein